MKELIYLNKYFKKYQSTLLLGILYLVFSNLFGVYAPQIVREAIDYASLILNGKNGSAINFFEGQAIAFTLHLALGEVFVFLGILYILVAIVKGVFLYFTRQTLIMTSRKIEFDLKNEIFSQYQSLDIAFYKRNSTGDLMNRISEDVSRVRMYLGPAIMYFINFIVLFILVVSTMFIINPKLSFYVLLPLPILSVSIYYVSKLINKKSEIVQAKLSDLTSFAQETFSGIRVIKAFNRSAEKASTFDKACEEYKNKNLDLVKVDALFMPMIILLIGLSTIITIFIGGKLAIAGEISNGNIAEFVIYVNMLTWPVASVGWITSITQRAAASQKRINEFLKQQPEITNETNETPEINGNIRFENVSFTYPDSGIQALKNISFNLQEGKSIAVVGKTGSGKSTLANLMLRLFDIDEGRISLDGKSIKEHNLNELRRNIGYVPQEVFLFSDSISNNIAFGTPRGEIDEKAIEEAARKAEVYSNIKEFKEGFNTKVGERGITLSGGQKQRISIARAFMKNPKILILDDCLSAVDTDTEEKILAQLKSLMKKKSSIIISHRISTIKHCDEIIVLDGGQLIEKGKHSDLSVAGGMYQDMYEKQLLEEQRSLVQNG